LKQKELSVWLRAVLSLVVIVVLFLAAVIVPELARETKLQNPEYAAYFWPCLIFVWVTTLPVLAVTVIAWLIFTDIGRDMSFSLKNATRLRMICYLFIADTVLCVAGILVLSALAAMSPGLFIILLCVAFMGFLLSVAAAALSHLTRKAAALKDENDLTI